MGGHAKAMVVTSGRPAVIRYKYAIQAYLKAHPEYDKEKIEKRLQFTVPGDPLVAFSGSVKGELAVMPEDDSIVDEKDYLKDNPFAQIRRDYDYTEENMNNLGYQTVEAAFDKPENRMLIVANKFQTGFNQKKLVAMYIDKRINNDIGMLNSQLDNLTQQLNERKANYVKSMRYMAKQHGIHNEMMFVFSAKDLTQLYRRMRFVRQYAAYQRS